MALNRTAEQWVAVLAKRLEAAKPDLDKYNRHYDLSQPLSYMHPELWLEVSERIKPVLIAWPQLVVDSVEERLDVEGFRYGGEDKDDAQLWEWWQANNLDEGSQQEHLEALIGGRAFVIVGTNDEGDDFPRITVESPLQVVADFDPQTRKVRAASKTWMDDNQTFVTLYLPNETRRYAKNGNGGLDPVADPDVHNLGRVPVVPFVNRGRILRMANGQMLEPGVSEMSPVLPLSDAACKVATDMMVAAETVAIPGRYAFGLSRDDFVDKDGNPISPWKQALGKVWAHEDNEIVAGQWPQADLANFHATINELARLTAAISALPPHFLGFSTDAPASADAIRSNEARLVKRAERKQTSFGESWEAVMSLATRIQTGAWDERERMLETRWRDASTPTIGQKADAAVKLVTARIIPPQQAQEDLGYTAGQMARMKEWQDEAVQRDAAAMLLGTDLPPAGQPTPPAQPAA